MKCCRSVKCSAERGAAGVGQDFVGFSRKCHRSVFVSVGSGLGMGGGQEEVEQECDGVSRNWGKFLRAPAGSGAELSWGQ